MYSISTVSMVPDKGLIYAGTYRGDILIFKYDEKTDTHVKIGVKELTDWVHLLHRTNNSKYIWAGAAGWGAKLWRIPSEMEIDQLFQQETEKYDTIKMRMKKLLEFEFMDYDKNILCSTDAIWWSKGERYMIIAAWYPVIENRINIRKWLFNVYDMKNKVSIWKHWINRNQHNVFILEWHPIYEEVFVTGGSVGEITLWNIKTKSPLKVFQECGTLERDIFTSAESFDGKFSYNGKIFVICTLKGTISIYSIFNNEPYYWTPIEQFFGKLNQDESGMSLEERARNQVLLKADYSIQSHQLPYSIIGPFRNFKLSSYDYLLKYNERIDTYRKEHLFQEHSILGYRIFSIENNVSAPNSDDNIQNGTFDLEMELISTQEVPSGDNENLNNTNNNLQYVEDDDDSSDEDYIDNGRPDPQESSMLLENTIPELSQEIEYKNGRARLTKQWDYLDINSNDHFSSVDISQKDSEDDYNILDEEEKIEIFNTKSSLKMELTKDNKDKWCIRWESKNNLIECKGCKENGFLWEYSIVWDTPNWYKYRLFPDFLNKVSWLYWIESKLKQEHQKVFESTKNENLKQFRNKTFISKLNRKHFEAESADNLYWPQTEDEVYFIYQGYEETMKDFISYFVSPSDLSKEYIETLYDLDKSRPVIRKISQISYWIPSLEIYTLLRNYKKTYQSAKDFMKIYAMITLESLGSHSQTSKKHILYFDDQISWNYLVPRDKYEKTIGIDLEELIGTEVDIDSSPPMKVKVISNDTYDDQYPGSLYKCLNVIDLEDKSNTIFQISPWELKASSPIKRPSILGKYQSEILSKIKDNPDLYSNPHYNIFWDRVDTKVYFDYYTVIPVMIYMDLIWKRLENNYYRSKNSLIWDIQQIETNWMLYNGETNSLSSIAGELCYKSISLVESVFIESIGHSLPDIIEENKHSESSSQNSNKNSRKGKRVKDESDEEYKEEKKEVNGVRRKRKEVRKSVLNEQNPNNHNKRITRLEKNKNSLKICKTQENNDFRNKMTNETIFKISKIEDEDRILLRSSIRRKTIQSDSSSDNNEESTHPHTSDSWIKQSKKFISRK